LQSDFYLFIYLFTAKTQKNSGIQNKHSKEKITSDSISKTDNGQLSHDEMPIITDTLIMSDYLMSIQRVSDILNAISDSVAQNFEVSDILGKLQKIKDNINLIRQNVRGRSSVINIKNTYLYQSFALNWDKENSIIVARLNAMCNKTELARVLLKSALSDPVFSKLYADSSLRIKLGRKLTRLEKNG